MNTKDTFVKFLVESGALKFGNFVTKSGRETPYFINTGEFRTGASLSKLAEFYAGCFWVISSAPKYCRYNMVFRYTPDFKFMQCQMIDSGWTNLGVQTVCLWGDKMLFGCYGTPQGKEDKFPHESCTLVVDGKALAFAGSKPEYPIIAPCEKRVNKNTAEGMLVLDGKLMLAHGIRLSPRDDRQNQRWSARLMPCTL